MINYKLNNSVIELAPGQRLDLELQISNASEIIDQFTLTLEPLASPVAAPLNTAWLSLTPTYFALRPSVSGQNPTEGDNLQTVRLTITLPIGTYAGSYAGQIVIAAASGPANSATVPLSIIVSEVEDLGFSLQPTAQTLRQGTALYRLSLTNQGNAPRLYSAFAEDLRDECRFALLPGEVTLNPGEQALLTLKVKPRQRNWSGSDKVYSFKVGVDGHPNELSGTFTQKAALPPFVWLRRKWAFIVVLLLLLIGLTIAALILWLPKLMPVQAASCAPSSLRMVNLVSNDINTDIFVSDRGGNGPLNRVFTERANVLPGLFASLLAVSPDGRRLAYVTADSPALNNARLMMLDLDTPKAAPVPLASIASGLWPVAPMWSSNGETLAFVKKSAGVAAGAATTASPTVTATTVATTAAADTTATPAKPKPTQLELWVVKPGEEAKPLVAPGKLERLDATVFYGDDSPVLCWNSSNSGLILRDKPTADNPAKTQVEIEYPGGALATRDLPEKVQYSVGSRVMMNVPLYAKPIAAPPPEKSSVPPSCAVRQPISQLDPRWADKPLKIGDTHKLSDYGCPLVAATMVLNLYGQDIQPDGLVDCMGSLTSPLNSLGWVGVSQKCSKGAVDNGFRTDFSWEALDAQLQKGPAIVGFLGGQVGTHFVVVNAGSGESSKAYRVTDPWDGSTYKTLDYFTNKGYRLRWLIRYEKTPLGCTLPNPADNLAINVTGVEDGKLYSDPQRLNYEVIGNGTVVSATARRVEPADVAINPALSSLASGFAFERSGVYTVSLTAKGSTSVTRNLRFVIDLLPPTVSATINIKPDDTGKYPLPVNISLNSLDNLSGIALIEFSKDGGTTWQPYTSDTTKDIDKLYFDKNGDYSLIYRAVDGAGNASDIGTLKFSIELSKKPNQKPTSGGTLTPGTNGNAPATTAAANPTTDTNPNQPTAPGATKKPTTTPAPGSSDPTTAPSTPPVTYPPAPTTPPAGTPPTSTPAPTASPTPTAPVSKAVLGVSSNSLIFTPDLASVTVEVSNSGTENLTWNLQPGVSASLVSFNLNTGTLAPGGKNIVKLTLLSPNNTVSNKTANFQLTSNGGTQTIAITILPQLLPSAVIAAPVNGATLPASGPTPIQLTVFTPALQRADHARLIATYKNCPACPLNDVLLVANLKADGSGNWLYNWDTSLIVPQVNIALRGKLCSSPDDSRCVDIPAVGGLIVAMNAGITSPRTGDNLGTATDVIVTPSGRANHVVLSYLVDGSTAETVLPNRPNPSNGWKVSWDTSKLLPGRNVTLKGSVCSSADDSVCQDILGVPGLVVPLKGVVNFAPSLASGGTLPNNQIITIDGPSGAIDHVSLYATYKDSPSEAIGTRRRLDSLNIVAPDWKATWNTSAIPPQSGITLEVLACFSDDDSNCVALIPSLTGLVMPYGTPASVETYSGSPQSAITGDTFTSQLQAVVKNGKGYGVPNVDVIWNAPSSGASGSFDPSTPVISVTSRTDPNGIATAPAFKANGTVGTYFVTAQVGLVATPAKFLLTNVAPDTIPLEAVGGSGQLNRVTGTFTNGLTVRVKDRLGNPVKDKLITYTSPPSGAGATFPGGDTALSNGSGLATSNLPQANCKIGRYTIAAVADDAYSPAYFTLENIAGLPDELRPLAGVSQTAKINEDFTTQFRVRLLDICDNPLIGLPVKFEAQTAITTGATGKFGTDSSFTTTTISDGVAIAAPFTANSKVGTYNIKVSAGSVVITSFVMTNLPGDPFVVEAVGSITQTTRVSTPFTPNLQVRVKDIGGNLLAGVPVTFSESGDGATFPGGFKTATVNTDPTGTATAPLLTASCALGTHNLVASSSPATPATFTLLNEVGLPNNITASSGTPQSIEVTKAYATPLEALVTDLCSNPLKGYSVTFAAPSASTAPGATFGGSTTITTDDSGKATIAGPTANTKAGTLTATATLSGVTTPASFSLTNKAGPAKNIAQSPASSLTSPITTTVGAPFAAPLVITVTDTYSNPVDSQPVVFQALTELSSGASAQFGGSSTFNINTDINGQATATTLTANTRIGSYRVTVNLTGVTASTDFYMRNVAGVPASLNPAPTSSSAAPLKATIYTKYPTLSVTVKDSLGNPIIGRQVYYYVTDIGATGPGAYFPGFSRAVAVTTDSSGYAPTPDLTASYKAGDFQVNVSLSGSSLTHSFYLQNQAGAPAYVALNPLNVGIITATVSTFYPTFTATVFDAESNPVPGATVTFTSSSAFYATFGGSTSLNITTDVNGKASTSPRLLATGLAGLFNMTVTISGSSLSYVYNLQNTPAPLPPSVGVTPGGGSGRTSATVKQPFAPLTIKIADADGNPYEAKVTFTAPPDGTGSATGTFAGGGSSATVSTDKTGTATAPTFTANGKPGQYDVTVKAVLSDGSVKDSRILLQNLAGPAATLSRVTPAASSSIGVGQSSRFAVTVKDSEGNPLSEQAVAFDVSSTSGKASCKMGEGKFTTGKDGQATSPDCVAGTYAGEFSVRASVVGTSVSTSFRVTVTPGSPAKLVIEPDKPLKASVGAKFDKFYVTVKDAYDNPISGLTVRFTAPLDDGTNASGTFDTNGKTTIDVPTDASGQAWPGSFTANSGAGSYKLKITLPSYPSLSGTIELTNLGDKSKSGTGQAL